jgi:hypothetical protein
MATYQPLSTLPNLLQNNTQSSTSNSTPMGVQAVNPSATPKLPSYTLPANQTVAPKSVNVQSAVNSGGLSPLSSPSTNNGSVVDYLASQGKASDYNSRAGLAKQYGISNYIGSADQNTQLLNMLKTPSSGASSSIPSPSSFTTANSTSSTMNPTLGTTSTKPFSSLNGVNYNAAGDVISNGASVPSSSSSTSTTPFYTSQTGNQSSTQTNTGKTTSGTSTPQTGTDTTYQGLIQQLVNKSQMSPEELAANQKIVDLKNQQAMAVGQEQMAPESNAYQTGRVGIINQIAQAQQANAAAQAENYAKQREVATNALNTATGYAKPVTMQYGQAMVNPQNAQDISSGQAYSGAQGLTNLGVAQTNIQQGQQYQKQAADLSTTLNQIDNLS